MLIEKCNKNIFKNLNFHFQNGKFVKSFNRAISTSRFSQNIQEDFIVKSPLKSLSYPKISIDQYVWSDINKWMNKTAIVDGITDQTITYAQLRDKCRAMAIRLRTTLNLRPRDTIAICLPNSIEFPIAALGACEAEVTVTTINPIYTADEIAHQLKDSKAKILFGSASNSKILQEAVQKAQLPIKVVYVTTTSNESIPAGGIKFHDLIETKGLDLLTLPDVDHDCDDVAFILYSSGTTGLSKGVMLSHNNINSNSIALRGEELKLASDSVGDYQDILPCVLPFFHCYGLVVTLLAKLAQGCKLVSLPRFHPETFLNAMEKYQGNVLHLAPPIIIFFNSFDKVRPEHTRSIKYVISGAAPLGSSDIEQFFKKAPNAEYIQAYGLTEASPVTHMMLKGCKKFSSIGVPLYDTESKICDVNDPEFRGLRPHEIGELLIRGPQVMLGYNNNEKATKDTITDDKWLRTGDIGYYDEDGNFYITDRLKELIKVKGYQVAPAELEEILRSHPEIIDAAVIGIPNPATGELPRAFVVTTNDSKLNEKIVQDFVSQKVSDYKKLAGGVEFVDSIPKNATGKILRRELRKNYC